MFEKFLSTNVGDFRQRYRGTYGFFIKDKVRQLVQLTDVSQDRRQVSFENKDGTAFLLNVDAEDGIGFEFLPPKSAWHNTVKGPMLVSRVAARQYQRGICSANTSIRQPGGRNIGVSFASLGPIFDGKEITVAAASRGESFALSPHFAVACDHGALYLFNQNIGTVAKKDDHFVVGLEKESMFMTEIQDAFRRANLKVEYK